ncbi:PAS domain-containing protein [Aestuariivirga sp.]|uniref:PAS domain-containing protein n=1 Tax=Aestuariivirga sp. TaxID=2650926 RepID=UPI0035B21D67
MMPLAASVHGADVQDDRELLREYREVRQALSALAAIYNDAPVGLAVIGADFRFQRINSRLAALHGVPAETHIGRTIHEVTPQLADIGESLIRKVVETGEPILNLEIEGETAAEPGVRRSFLQHWSPIRGEDGTVVAVNVVAEETTAQKRAARALQTSEATVRNVLNAMGDAFAVVDKAFRIVLANSEAARINGNATADMVGQSFWDVWPAAPGTTFEALLREVMAEKLPRHLEHHYVSDDQDLWLDISAYPTSDGVAVFYRDISDRKRAEDELKRNERRLSTALRAGKLGVFEHHFRPRNSYYWDSTVRQIWGVDEDTEITDAVFWPTIHPEDGPRVRAVIAEAAAAGTLGRVDTEYRIYRASDGALRWVNVALDIISDGRGPYRVIGTAQDITERKEAEEHAQLLMREINHRSKNLLAVVQSIAHQMARNSDLETFPQRFAERLASLASSQDLLVKNNWRGVPLDKLIASQLSHYKHLLGSRIHLDGEDLRIAPATAQNIGMALHELATNAAKYGALSDDRGEVVIAWDAAADDGQFSLSWTERNGPPVAPPEHRGLGSFILTRMFRHALGGEVTQEFPPEGLRWSIRAPAASILEAAEG